MSGLKPFPDRVAPGEQGWWACGAGADARGWGGAHEGLRPRDSGPAAPAVGDPESGRVPRPLEQEPEGAQDPHRRPALAARRPSPDPTSRGSRSTRGGSSGGCSPKPRCSLPSPPLRVTPHQSSVPGLWAYLLTLLCPVSLRASEPAKNAETGGSFQAPYPTAWSRPALVLDG